MAQKEPETTEPTLDAYRFYERDWGDYEALRERFEGEGPDKFNVATYICGRWAEADPVRIAMVAVDTDDADTEHPTKPIRKATSPGEMHV